MSLNVRVLPASPGDSILLSYTHLGRVRNIIIDGGIGETYYGELKWVISDIVARGEFVDLLVITHVDYDHIEGICRWFEDEEGDKSIVKRIWFNSGDNMKIHLGGEDETSREITLTDSANTKQSISQGMSLEKIIKTLDCRSDEVVVADSEGLSFEGLKIWVLSPRIEELKKLNKKWEIEENKEKKMSFTCDYANTLSELNKNKFVEDRSQVNRASIALLIEKEGRKILLGGDAVPSVLVKSLKDMGYNKDNKLKLDLIKVAHHGSKKNTSKELLEILECNNFVISSDASTHGLPNKECFARIIEARQGKANLFFNYDYVTKKEIFLEEDYKAYKFTVCEMQENTPYQVGSGVTLWK